MILFQNEPLENAVDFLLEKFPPGTNSHPVTEEVVALPQVDDPIHETNVTEVIAASPQVDDQSEQDGVEDSTDKSLRFDPYLGADYGFTEINVRFSMRHFLFIFF